LAFWTIQGGNREDPEQAFAAQGVEIESWRAGEGAAKGLAHRAAARLVAMDRRPAARIVMGAMRHRLMDRGRFVRGGRTRALREKTKALQQERESREENDKAFSALDSPYPREIPHKRPFLPHKPYTHGFVSATRGRASRARQLREPAETTDS
jgi:hypothetical protein